MPSLRAVVTREALRLAIRATRSDDGPTPATATRDDLERAAGALRARFDRLARFTHTPSDVEVTPAGGPVPGEWVASERAEPGRTLLYLHGGAYVSGSPATHRGIAVAFSRRSRAAVLLPQYRLAPEHPYPAALDDVLATYRWLLDATGQDPARLAVAGDSAGGGLALALVQALRDAGDPLPAGVALLSPWADLTGSGDSIHANSDVDPWLDGPWIAPFGSLYGGDRASEPGASPVFGDFSGLPPMLVHVGSEEVLLDDARRVVAHARAAGVDASLGVHDGLWHVFQVFSHVPEARQSLRELAGFVRRTTTVDLDVTTHG